MSFIEKLSGMLSTENEDEIREIIHTMNESGEQCVIQLLSIAKKDSKFGNGRYVRNLVERSINNQALRLNREGNLTKDRLAIITGEDIRGEG